ncbi:hypothetical protein BH10CHL1_BH10CHL1_03000 [soil metagenome]
MEINDMFFKVALALVLSAVICYYALRKNIKPNSDISLQSRIALFCGGFVAIFLGGWLLSPDITFWTRFLMCIVGGVLGGIGLAYTYPRQWREIQGEMEQRKQNKSDQ